MGFIRRRNLERIFLLLIGTVLTFLFMKLFAILELDFENTPKRLADGSIINLNAGKPGEQIRSLLTRGYYFEDPKDINLASAYVTQGFVNNPEPMENIGALNKKQFNIPTEIAYTEYSQNRA